jgi:AmmeMemoRadiSam system protein B
MNELQNWLKAAKSIQPLIPNQFIKAIIGPHAGYAYCGDNAAFAYSQLLTQKAKKYFTI